MNLARILVLVIALAAGGGAAYLAMTMINNQEPAPAPAAAVVTPQVVESEQVLIARENLPVGAILEARDLAWRSWPEAGLTESYILRSEEPDVIDEFVGTIARTSFLSGEPITREKLVRTDGGLLSAILPAGMRAIATEISAVSSAGGFILPNDRVDVIMSRAIEGGASTETILNNIRVLAIDQAVEDREGEQVVVGQTATLEVTPLQVQILTAARQLDARLILSLRSVEDANEVVNPALDAVHLLGGPADAAQVDPGRAEPSVTVIRNGVASQFTPGQ